MQPSGSVAKVARPSVSGSHSRRGLLRLLDKSCRSSIVWICGPPGCGKTTLAASFVEEKALACLWYQVDEGDPDLATFFYYLGLAGRQAAPPPFLRDFASFLSSL